MKTGRPTRYDEDEHPKIARKLTGEGKTCRDLAELFEVNPDTITEWQNKHPEFSVAIKLGREEACDKVERALMERAVGYSHEAVKILVVDNEVVRENYTEHYPPETAAASLFLRNRRAKEWTDKTAVEHTGKVTLETVAERLLKARAPRGD